MDIYQRKRIPLVIWAVYLAVFSFPLDFTIIDGITLFRLIASLTICLWLINILIDRKGNIYINRVTWFSIFFSLYGLLSVLWATSRQVILETTMLLLLFISLYSITVQLISTKELFRRLELSYIYGSTFAGLIAIYSAIFKAIPQVGRVSPFLHQNLNIFGTTMAIGLLIIFHLIWSTKKYSKRLYFLGIGIILFVSLFLSGSRMAWLSLIVSVIISFTFLKTKYRKKAIIYLILIASFGGGCLYLATNLNFLPKDTINHLLARTSINYSIQDRGAQRLGIWLIGWNMFKDNPIFGIGLQNFVNVLYDKYSSLTYLVNYRPIGGPHNMYLSVLVELGITGALIFLLVLIFSFRYALRCREPSARFMSFTIMNFLAMAGFLATLQIFPYFWILLSLSHTCSRAHYLERKY